MIEKALSFIAEQLSQNLQVEMGISKSIVKLADLASTEDNSSMQEDSELIISMVNLTEESSLANRPSFQRQGTIRLQDKTPIHLNVHFLISTSLKGNQYKEGLSWISMVINYFHQNPVFSTQWPYLPKGIDKMSIEIVNMNIESMSQLWTALGASYQPSVLYSVRIIMRRSDALDPIIPEIT